MEKRVEGIYPNVQEALQAVDRLREKGYTRKNITIVANEEVRRSLAPNIDAEVTTQDTGTHRSMDRVDEEEHDHSLWESIKDFFTMDDTYDHTRYDEPDYDVDSDPLYVHRDAIARGEVAVLVSGHPTADTGVERTDTHMDTDRPRTETADDETIELREEHLKVDKEKEKTGEVHITKKVVEDTETIEVPVTREEVTIERRPVSGEKASDQEIELTDDEEIVIPVEEEKVKPRKETEVVEEIVVKKETKEDTQTVGDTVRREEIEVEEEGDVRETDDSNLDNLDNDRRNKR